MDVNWPGEKSRYLPQDGLCDDIAFDHATSRLAMVNESGQVDVFRWNFGTFAGRAADYSGADGPQAASPR